MYLIDSEVFCVSERQRVFFLYISTMKLFMFIIYSHSVCFCIEVEVALVYNIATDVLFVSYLQGGCFCVPYRKGCWFFCII